MKHRRPWLALWAILLLTRPDGGRLWIVESQIVAVLEMHDVGASPTAIVTVGGGPFYVREPAASVVQMLGWKRDDD